ncbi:hypothetical protein K503DRAFT_802302 [Rhizopogon vinicolor AM-OR11-026]|uniref:Uncharacterized protein n=1 Tax=Rhizopogon vinicolor AM-OR11-026 TaxID=1314800 RepID=A0A1B7MU37_9AGAM|nr:hypothetical protein K503DRAFT_802302 [Rhizopogon vinicolor AM-OR11-026]
MLKNETGSLRQTTTPQAVSTSQNKVLDNLTTLDQIIGSTGFIYALVSPAVWEGWAQSQPNTSSSFLPHVVLSTTWSSTLSPRARHTSSSYTSGASDTHLQKLPIDKLNGRAVTLEGVRRLFDLIKPNDPRFAHAFYEGFLDVPFCRKS